MTGRYVAFEGIDGVGKSTVMEAVGARLRTGGRKVETVREPGGTEAGEAIRDILLHNHDHLEATTEALLFAAARAQLARERIAPLVASGVWVLADRSLYSSLAYQGVGRDLGLEVVESFNRFAVGDVLPDLVILLRVEPAVGLARQDVADRIGAEGVEFQAAVAGAYDKLAADLGFRAVDASRSFEEVVAESVELIEQELGSD